MSALLELGTVLLFLSIISLSHCSRTSSSWLINLRDELEENSIDVERNGKEKLLCGRFKEQQRMLVRKELNYPAAIGEVPFLASIEIKHSTASSSKVAKCVGSIFGEKLIITSAKCALDATKYSYIVRIGDNKENFGHIVKVDKTFKFLYKTANDDDDDDGNSNEESDCDDGEYESYYDDKQLTIEHGFGLIELKEKIGFNLNDNTNRICVDFEGDYKRYQYDYRLFSTSFIDNDKFALVWETRSVPINGKCSSGIYEFICERPTNGLHRIREGAPIFEIHPREKTWYLLGVHTKLNSIWNNAGNESLGESVDFIRMLSLRDAVIQTF